MKLAQSALREHAGGWQLVVTLSGDQGQFPDDDPVAVEGETHDPVPRNRSDIVAFIVDPSKPDAVRPVQVVEQDRRLAGRAGDVAVGRHARFVDALNTTVDLGAPLFLRRLHKPRPYERSWGPSSLRRIWRETVSPNPHDEFVTTEWLAERWHTTPHGVHQLRHRGDGPLGHRIGRRILFKLS